MKTTSSTKLYKSSRSLGSQLAILNRTKSRLCNSVKVLALGVLVFAPMGVVKAAPIVTNTFDIGYGYTLTGWNTTETAGTNVPVSTADFTLTIVMVGTTFSGNGPIFTGGVLADGSGSAYSGQSATFGATITAAYTGTPVLGAEIKLVIDSIDIYGNRNTAAPAGTGMQWSETTTGNTATGPLTSLSLSSGAAGLQTASDYTLVAWNPGDNLVLGESSIRTFGVATDGDNRTLDGFSVTGHIEYGVVPEPTVAGMLLACAGLALCRRSCINRARRDKRTLI